MTRDLTDDRFLGGRLRILQPKSGFRAAIDSVLLPAAVSSENGLDVLDAGAGIGVGALCLRARDTIFRVVGIELDPALAEIARDNAARNKLDIDIQCRDLLASARDDERALFDQVMTNPPYIEAGRGTAPHNPARALAQVAGVPLVEWINACLAHLKPGGTLTLIHRADHQREILAALAQRACGVVVLPLVPREGQAPHRLIVRARLDAVGGITELPAFALHGDHEKYTPQAETVLRHGAPLSMEP